MRSYAKLIAVCAITLTTSSACISDGIKEPKVEVCSIYSMAEADCEVSGTGKVIVRPTSQMLGYQCVSARDFARIEAHHEILHREINEKKKK